jgi:hypothetical protein
MSGAWVARQRRWPAVALGALDERGVAPRAREREDDAEHLDASAIRRTVDVALQLVARLDADLATRSTPPPRPARRLPRLSLPGRSS